MKRLRNHFNKIPSVHKLSLQIKLTHFARIFIAVTIVSIIALPIVQYFSPGTTIAEAAVGTIRPDGDITTSFASCTGAACSSGYYAVLNDTTPNLSTYVSTGTNGATGDEVEFSMTSIAGPTDAVTQVDVKFLADVATCLPFNITNHCDQINARLFINGSYQAAQTFVVSDVNTLYTATFNGTWVGDGDIQVELVRTARGTGAQSARDDDVRIYQVYAEVTYESSVNLTQSAHRFFANTDSTNVGSALAAQDAPATLSDTGQAFRLRQNLHVSSGDLNQGNINFSLQYVDKGTGTCQAPSGGNPATYTSIGQGKEWKDPIWQKRNSFQAIEFDGKMWVIGGFSGNVNSGSYSDVWYTTDGLNWELATNQPGWAGRQQHTVAVLNGKMWVIGGYDGSSALSDVWSSSDGVNWTQETASAAFGGIYRSAAVGFNNKLWVMGGWNGSSFLRQVWSSTDGATWTLESTPAWSGRSLHEAVVFDGKIWLMGGFNGTSDLNDVYSSTDGTSWTQETASANWSGRETFGLAAVNNKLWVLGGWSGARRNDVWSSSDGVNWTQETSNAGWDVRSYLEAVGYDGKIWVMGGVDTFTFDDVWSSSDGSSWASVVGGITPRTGAMSVVHDGKMWLAGGLQGGSIFLNDVYFSSDGVNWVKATGSASWTARMSGALLSYDNKLWIMGGWDGSNRRNDVWSSTDGITWNQETSSANWPVRNLFSAVTYDNKMWVMAGLGNSSTTYRDVWSSTDGSTWTQETGTASWSARYGSNLEVFNGKMLLMAGDLGVIGANDVWSSSDGVNWTQETASAGWDVRYDARTTVLDGRIWILGGQDGSDNLVGRNDLWSSSDGVNWVEENSAVYPRMTFRNNLIGFDDRLWIIAGNDAAVGTIQNVHFSPKSPISWSDNPTPTHNSSLTANANDPIHSGHTKVNQSYVEYHPFSNNQAAILDGQDGLWDFSLKDFGAPANTTYCFRIVTSDGVPIDTYSSYPTITTFNDAAPPVPTLPPLENILRGGKGFIQGVKLPFFTNK